MAKSKFTACIATPTLDIEMGRKAVLQAAKTAGVPVCTHIVVDEKREGGCKTANKALRGAYDKRTPFIAYINDDVVIKQKGWLKRLISVLQSNPRYGIAAPGCKCGTRPQMAGKPGLPPKVHTVKQLSFVTAVFRRGLFTKLGFFDEGYYHWGCDSEYCERVRKAGYRLLYVQDVFVIHNTVPHRQRDPHVQRWKQLDVARWKARKR